MATEKTEKEQLAEFLASANQYDNLHAGLPKPSELINKAWLYAYRLNPKDPLVVGAFRFNWDENPPENPEELDTALLRTLIGLRKFKEQLHKITSTEQELVKRITEYLNTSFKTLLYPGFLSVDARSGQAAQTRAIELNNHLALPSRTGTATVVRSREASIYLSSDALRIETYPATETAFADYLADLRENMLDGVDTATGNPAIGVVTLDPVDNQDVEMQLIRNRVDQLIETHKVALRNRFFNTPARGTRT